jgi:ADP-ribosylglycohydrolase
MIGAIAGDIVGSVYEGAPIKTKDFPLFRPGGRFTDDSVLTVAVATAILERQPYRKVIRDFGRRYPRAGYGAGFYRWLATPDARPYHSWGNGSAMRVSAVGFAFETEDAVLAEAQRSAECTHNHPEGIKGAQAVALAVLLARKGAYKQDIRSMLEDRFGYSLHRSLDELRPGYTFDVSCQGSVPASIICFLEGQDWESTVRNAISLGGDSDTMACIAGGVAEAFYGPVPGVVCDQVRNTLTDELWQAADRFCRRFVKTAA